MTKIGGPERGEILDFWPSGRHEAVTMIDVRTRIFSGAAGASTLRFNTHVASLNATNCIATTSLDGDPPVDIEWPKDTVGFLPANTSYKTTINQPRDFTAVRFQDRFLRGASYETIDASKANLRFMPAVPDLVAVHLMKSLEQLAMNGSEREWPMLVDSLGTALAVRWLQILGGQRPKADPPYPGGLPPNRLQRVLDYIEAFIQRPIRLSEIANVAALSPHHFARAFQKTMGIPPVRYVWRRRIERAKPMLANLTIPLAVIAYECGFSSQSHFTTVFKRETGLTPAAYRAQNQP